MLEYWISQANFPECRAERGGYKIWWKRDMNSVMALGEWEGQEKYIF